MLVSFLIFLKTKAYKNGAKLIPKKWLHINEAGGDPWVLPIWSSIHKAIKEGRIKEPAENIGELSLFISIRLNMLPRIVKRINSECNDLYKEIKDITQEYVFNKNTEGYAFEISGDLKYELLIDIDSLFFELNSSCELMKKYFLALYKFLGAKIDKNDFGKKIKNILNDGGIDSKWFINLDKHRNFFMHEGAPYIAIDLSDEPISYDLLIMKENIKVFDNADKFVRLSELNEIVEGFLRSRDIVQRHLIQQIDSFKGKSL